MYVILSTVPAGKVLWTPHQGAGLRGTTGTLTVLKMGLATLQLGTGLGIGWFCLSQDGCGASLGRAPYNTLLPTLARRTCLPNRIDSWVSFRATSRQ